MFFRKNYGRPRDTSRPPLKSCMLSPTRRFTSKYAFQKKWDKVLKILLHVEKVSWWLSPGYETSKKKIEHTTDIDWIDVGLPFENSRGRLDTITSDLFFSALLILMFVIGNSQTDHPISIATCSKEKCHLSYRQKKISKWTYKKMNLKMEKRGPHPNNWETNQNEKKSYYVWKSKLKNILDVRVVHDEEREDLPTVVKIPHITM
jgi:hypothetical protein